MCQVRVYGGVKRIEIFPQPQGMKLLAPFRDRLAERSADAPTLIPQEGQKAHNRAFREALETGSDVNVIARMSDDCRAGISGFLKKK